VLVDEPKEKKQKKSKDMGVENKLAQTASSG